MTAKQKQHKQLRVIASPIVHPTRRSRPQVIRTVLPTASEPLSRLMADILDNGQPKPGRIDVGLPVASLAGRPSRSKVLLGQLSIGQILIGYMGRYRIQRLARRGEHSDTYFAAVASRVKGSALPGKGSPVVVKIPRVPDDMTDAGAADRLRILVALFRAEVAALSRLDGVSGVARFLDRGKYNHRLQAASKSSVFVVQEYVDGDDLVPYLASRYGRAGRFCGIPSAKDFFRWARRLTETVSEIHKRLVVHGFIWPMNIRVNARQEPVLVDFGEGLFAQVMNDSARLMDRAGRYIAPERIRGVGGDLYSLGGVLYYLGAGEDPPRPYEDIEVLKQQVETSIRSNNEELLRDNCGVVDIIARCLRYSHKGRVENAVQLLRDIDTFDVSSVSHCVVREALTLTKHARKMDASGHSLLGWMAVLQVRELAAHFENMTRGVYDLTADADTIRGTVAGLMSILGAGDEFVSVALPKFWRQQNIGINGRFLSKTKEAVQRGVQVRRVFLIDSSLTERELEQIVAAQQRVSVELNYSPKYSVRYLSLARDELDQLVREGKHFGLFIRQGSPTAFFPQYRADDTLETLRFRTDPAIVRGLRDIFRRLDEDDRTAPLADLRLPATQVG